MSTLSIQDNFLYYKGNKVSMGLYNSSPPMGGEYSYHYINNYEQLFEEVKDYINDDLDSKIKEEKLSVLPEGLCLIKDLIPPRSESEVETKVISQLENGTLFINISELPNIHKSIDILPSPLKKINIGKDSEGKSWYCANFQISGIVKGINEEMIIEKLKKFCWEREVAFTSSKSVENGVYNGKIQAYINKDLTVEEAFSYGIEKTTDIIDKFIFALIGLEGILEVWEYWQNNRNKKLKEASWQEIFKKYPWLLAQCFAVPHIIFKEQCYIGGTTSDGKGSKYPDFIYTTSCTENMMIVEIKKPNHKLMVDAGRGKIFAPSADINKGVGQVLFYKDLSLKSYSNTFMLNSQMAGKKSEIKNLRNPRCILIIGSLDEFTGDNGEVAKQGFDLYRNELRSVEIITYDELFEKLKTMMQLVSSKFFPLT